MSELWALLPGVQARQIQQTLTTTAQGLGAADARSMDQRRADTLVDLLLGRTEPAPVSMRVIVPADTLTGVGGGPGAGTEPGWVPGLGPVTTEQIDRAPRRWHRCRCRRRGRCGAGWPQGDGSPVGDRPCHRGADRSGRGPVPAVSGAGPGGPGQGCDLPVPRLPPCRRQRRHRPGPHRPLPGRTHIGGEPGGALPPAPPPQAHRRLVRHPRPHRDDDLDHPHRPHLPHRPLALHHPWPTTWTTTPTHHHGSRPTAPVNRSPSPSLASVSCPPFPSSKLPDHPPESIVLRGWTLADADIADGRSRCGGS